MEKIKKYKDYLVLFVLTIISFHFSLGFEKFNPSNISWLFEARLDWSTHYLGWAFFRDAPWQFPLGTIDNYYYPIGTNIGFTDSIPLVAIILKPFSFLLPENFQYFGIWLLLCMFLNGYYSLKIFNYFKINKTLSYLLVIFILINPVFIFRQIHPSYCAHWLLIGSIYLYLSTNRNTDLFNKNLKHFVVLLALSSLITVYLTVAVFGLFVLFVFKLFYFEKLINIKKAVIYLFTSLVIIFTNWILVGLVDLTKHTEIASKGFYGVYKMNLNSLYNSMGYSKLLPSFELISGYQYDAFMYLGLGLMILIIMSIGYLLVYLFKNKKIFFNKKLIPLLIFCLGLSVFAATNSLSFNNKVIFTIPFLEKMERLGDIFRASGRFFWSVYYLIIFYFILIFHKIPLNKYFKYGIVFILLIIQIIDIKPMFERKETQSGDYKPSLNINLWNSIFSNFKNVITVMPFNNDLVNYQDYQEIAYFAYKNKTTVTNGNLARYDGRFADVFTNNLINDIINGNFPKENLYITSRENLKYFSLAYEKKLITILTSDGYYFIYSKSKILNNLPLLKDTKELQASEMENVKEIEFEICDKPLEKSFGNVKSNIENELVTDLICQLKGWAFIEESSNNMGDSIFIYLKNDKNLYKSKCIISQRKDISIVFDKENLDNSGFESFTYINNIEKGLYNLILAIKDKKGDLYYSNTSKTINIGYKLTKEPIKIDFDLKLEKKINYNIDNFEIKEKELKIFGWAIFNEIESTDSTIEILMLKDDAVYRIETLSNVRKDVTEAFKNGTDYDNSGFEVIINTQNIPKGNYKIGIRIVNQKQNKDGYLITNKRINI